MAWRHPVHPALAGLVASIQADVAKELDEATVAETVEEISKA